VSGNAFRHALSEQVHASIGVFTDLTPLVVPNNYQEFFLPRMKKIMLIPNSHTWTPRHTRKVMKDYSFTVPGITFDLVNPPDDFVETVNQKGLIQFGRKRNNGYGVVQLHHHLWLDVADIPLPDVATHLKLISPVFELPNFVHAYKCRRDHVIFWNHGEKKKKNVIPQGQFFRLKEGCDIAKIARKGILRKILFGKFGFGEFILRDWSKKEANGA
jgi:hypothetical protein